MEIENLVAVRSTIVDVRTPMEFMSGHVVGAINIPLNEIPQRIEEIRKLEQPFILCCMSGARSGQAAAFLKSNGIDCFNGGSWLDLNKLTADLVQ